MLSDISLCRIVTLAAVLALACGHGHARATETAITYEAGRLRVQLDSTGQVRSLKDLHDRREYLPENQPAPLLVRDLGERLDMPVRMTPGSDGRTLTLLYADDDVSATIEVTTHATHLTFTLTRLTGPTPEKVLWGPFPTLIKDNIGGTVGVVWDDNFALGIQGLNIKTPAGARGAGFGSTLFASSRDRTSPRLRTVSNVKRITVSPMAGPDATLEGSRIALFGCASDEALARIGQIELAEGLPHPMLDGVWAKTSPEATRSYMIIPFDERTLDRVLDVAARAGLKYIYHEHPFKSWGHFKLEPAGFPDGLESMRRCVQRAEAAGIRVGVHTLSNFIHPHDPYVSPVPDPRLMRLGTSTLTGDVDEKATTIPIADAQPFRHLQWLSTVVIGQELIRYTAVSETEPWMLLGCRRGSFGSTPAVHAAGASVGKLWDHEYKVFFPNLDLQDEIADHLVELFNRTGMRQISFDGLEGCQVTGEDIYAEARFVKRCYDGWQHEIISDSSQLNHFTWHIHTRMNWGEPWGKAMREGMPEYRFKNQEYFRQNLFPPMLGWFQIQRAVGDLEATTLDDVEWVLAKCAGFGAGCAWYTHLDTLDKLGGTREILNAIRQWDRARHLGAFSKEQQARLRSTTEEFHLQAVSDSRWQLTPVTFSSAFRIEPGTAGAPSAQDWEVNNPYADQPLRFVLRVAPQRSNAGDGHIDNPSFTIADRTVTFPARLAPGQYLVYDGAGDGQVYDANWNRLSTVSPKPAVPVLPSGRCQIRFNCEAGSESQPEVGIRFKTVGSPEPVG